jgi:hypothetical protein
LEGLKELRTLFGIPVDIYLEGVRRVEQQNGGISRREFLKDASLLAGGAISSTLGFGSSCSANETPGSSELITVLNPEGLPPPIVLSSMAPRLDSLDGKKIYLVDIHFTGSQIFLEEMAKTLQEKYPKASIIYKLKAGAYAENDAALWEEIEKNGDGVVMGIGH